MSEQPITDAQLKDLLRQTQQCGDEMTREFAHTLLRDFRDRCAKILLSPPTEEQSAVLRGTNPHAVRQQTNLQIAEERRRLYEQLTSLLEWARKRPAAPERS